MVDLSLRERLIERLKMLTDDQVAALLGVAEVMQPGSAEIPYDEVNDPIIGMFSGPTDLSERAKDILRNEITRESGWTQKKDQPCQRSPIAASFWQLAYTPISGTQNASVSNSAKM